MKTFDDMKEHTPRTKDWDNYRNKFDQICWPSKTKENEENERNSESEREVVAQRSAEPS